MQYFSPLRLQQQLRSMFGAVCAVAWKYEAPARDFVKQAARHITQATKHGGQETVRVDFFPFLLFY